MVSGTCIPAFDACVRAELDHPKGDRSPRVCVSVSGRADEWIDKRRQVTLAVRGRRSEQEESDSCAKNALWMAERESIQDVRSYRMVRRRGGRGCLDIPGPSMNIVRS